MSYVTSYGGNGATDMLQTAGNVVPLWAYAGRKMAAKETSGWQNMALIGSALVVGALLATAMFIGFPVALAFAIPASGMASNPGHSWRGTGAAGTNTIKRSDSYAWAGSPNKMDTFLGRGVGPEFVEQPNYVLGQENMQRSALSKYTRLKAQGAQVGSWPVFWAAYKAENSDDLDTSMYDFGDSDPTSTQWDKVAQSQANRSGFDNKNLGNVMRGSM